MRNIYRVKFYDKTTNVSTYTWLYNNSFPTIKKDLSHLQDMLSTEPHTYLWNDSGLSNIGIQDYAYWEYPYITSTP